MNPALGFLTILGRSTRPDESTLEWFPLVGALIGAGVGAVWWGADRLWPHALAAALVLAVDLAITGMLHLDGLIDSADAILPHMERARRFEVMSEPTVGAFGVSVVIVVFITRWASLATMVPRVALIAALWCVARTVMAVTVRAQPYAKSSEGLASLFVGPRSWISVGLTGSILALGLGALGDGVPGLVAVLVAGVTGAGVVAFARRQLGGYTGDVLGAAGVLAETAGLIVAAAKW